jgi:photosystem II stability/assembly factor-like uncharacterized protein
MGSTDPLARTPDLKLRHHVSDNGVVACLTPRTDARSDHRLFQLRGGRMQETGTCPKNATDYGFFDESNGICVTRDGSILATSDGGTEWKVIYKWTHNVDDEQAIIHWTALCCVGDWVWIASELSGIVYSTNRGQTWTWARTPVTRGRGALKDLRVTSSGLGVAITERGDIWSSKDKGRVWSVFRSFPGSVRLRNLAVTPSGAFHVSGRSGLGETPLWITGNLR